MTLRSFFVGRAIGFFVLIIILGLVAGFFAFNDYIYEQKQAYAAEDYKEGEYIIDGTRVRLGDDTATRYFGNEVELDLNDDDREDVVFLVTHQPGGSGTFYYAVAALNTERGYVGSEAFLLGDRIAPQTTERGKGKIVVVNYADRAPGEPFTTEPSVAKTIWLFLDPNIMQFGEVEQNFEGEADPSVMKLDMKTWVWVSALYNDGRELKPTGTKPFTLTFGQDGRFSATTDCNSMGGTYTAGEDTLVFSEIVSTKMFCEGSQEGDFASMLETTSGYHFTSQGWLILDLKFDSGSVVFR